MRFTIGKKLAVGFGIVFVLMIITTGASYYKLTQLGEAQNELIQKRMPIFGAAHDLQTAGQVASSNLRGYLLLVNSPEQQLDMKQKWARAWERLDKDAAKTRQQDEHRYHQPDARVQR